MHHTGGFRQRVSASRLRAIHKNAGLDDLGDENVTVEGGPLVAALGEGATLAKRCKCAQPCPDGSSDCQRCGHPLANRLLTNAA